MENKEQKVETVAQRFTNAVVTAYGDVAKGIEVTPKQLSLISNYYIKLDESLRNSKQKYTWKQVRLNELATTLAHMAKLNLDMSLGQLSFIPFKHKDTGTINLVPVIGAKGYEYIAKNFGLDPPKNVVIELVYSSDRFSVVKKDATHDYDSYIFEVTNPFDRGNIIGGFGYLEYGDKSKNKILVMSEKDILKYRPQYYDQNFWSGENMKKMYEKTIAKQLLKKVVLDPDKVNDVKDSFNRIEAQEINYTASIAQSEIDENMCSGEVIDIEVEVSEPVPVENSVEGVEDTNLFGENVIPEDEVL